MQLKNNIWLYSKFVSKSNNFKIETLSKYYLKPKTRVVFFSNAAFPVEAFVSS